MHSRLRMTVTVALVSCGALILGACGSSSSSKTGGGGQSGSSAPTAAGDYVIGVDDPLSGPLAIYGNSTLLQIRAAADLANSRGGINGHRVRIVTADMAAAGANAT